MREDAASDSLLAWYETHARELPWRVSPHDTRRGVRADPYRVWLSEIMLQQTTVAVVGRYFLRFLKLWPDVRALAAAADERVMAEWAGLGYYARARNLLRCARIVATDHGGRFPDRRDELQKLPGIGPYTAAAIAAIAFDRAETVVDGNVERVMARRFAIRKPLEKAKPTLRKLAAGLTPRHRPGDHAQALMDLGATICTPKAPRCPACPWQDICRARILGIAASLPRRTPKAAKPVRHGIAYLARRADGAWLLEQRPDTGLLGGMLGWPGTGWVESVSPLPAEAPPLAADWRDPGAQVRHTFTHFHLRLALRVATPGPDVQAAHGRFMAETDFSRTDLPTVMRKAYDIARAHLAAEDSGTG